MTRINVVQPAELTREHLVAEYREIVRVFALVRNAQNSGKKKSDLKIPKEYLLGGGHVTFFYDKLTYVLARYRALVYEMRHRGYSPNPVAYESLMEGIGQEWFGCYEPTPEAIALNRARIQKRLSGDKT